MSSTYNAAWIGSDGFEDPSRLTYDVVQWFARSVRARVTTPVTGYEQWPIGTVALRYIEAGAVTADDLAQWFVASISEYVRWKDHEEYNGDGFPAGGWKIAWDRVAEDLPRAVEASQSTTAREHDAAHVTDLDSWLRADIAGTLAYAGAIGGSKVLSAAERERLKTAAVKRRKRLRRMTPRACVCGDTFTPARFNSRHCPKCLANARAIRERGRQQP